MESNLETKLKASYKNQSILRNSINKSLKIDKSVVLKKKNCC